MRKATLKASVAALAPKRGGDELLAHQAGDARRQGQQGNGGGGLQQVHAGAAAHGVGTVGRASAGL